MNIGPHTEPVKVPPKVVYMRKKKHDTMTRTVLIMLGIFALTLSVFILLGAVPAVDGKPLLSHLSPLVSQTITTAGIVIPTLLPVLLPTKRDTARTREQVQNDHPINLRDENDDRHHETMKALATIDSRLRTQSDQIGHLQGSHIQLAGMVSNLQAADRGQESRISGLEETMTGRGRTKNQTQAGPGNPPGN